MAETSVPYEAALDLPATPEAAAAAREFLRESLRIWRLEGLGEVTALLTSELVTNVIRHVREPMTVRAHYDGSRIRVEVDDSSQALPRLTRPDVHDERGRGLVIIENLSAAWGARPQPRGKTVWFELVAHPPHAEDTRSSPTGSPADW